ncbi:hypothetical protein HOY82DRAFT_619046 [Tuber indicum]|nr:hypothetical protein HOY82DRAFT_619046 [Tuber indicum]
MLNAAKTRSFGYRLLLLLPVNRYNDVARKTTNPIWSFLLHQIPWMTGRVTDLGKKYELTVRINPHEVNPKDFDTCIRSYPKLDITATLTTIQRYGALHGSSLAALNYSQEMSEEEELVEQLTSSADEEEQSSTAKVLEEQSTSEADEGDDLRAVKEDGAHWTTDIVKKFNLLRLE